MLIQIKKQSVSLITSFFLLISCNNSQKNQSVNNDNYDDRIENDSISIYIDKKGHMECIYNILNNKEKFVKEGICFLSNGDIDYDKSTFLEIKGKDLYYHSPYDKSYKIGKKRYVIFKGNDSISKDFSNIQKINFKEFNFNESGIIADFKNKIPKIGIVEETIFIDTLIKSGKENKKMIRTIESYIDTDNLLINKLIKSTTPEKTSSYKYNKTRQ